MILLTLIMYVFSVLFAQAVGDVLNGSPNDLGDHFAAAEVYFFGLDSTMLSLFMSIAGGVSWEEVIRPLQAGKAWPEPFGRALWSLLELTKGMQKRPFHGLNS